MFPTHFSLLLACLSLLKARLREAVFLGVTREDREALGVRRRGAGVPAAARRLGQQQRPGAIDRGSAGAAASGCDVLGGAPLAELEELMRAGGGGLGHAAARSRSPWDAQATAGRRAREEAERGRSSAGAKEKTARGRAGEASGGEGGRSASAGRGAGAGREQVAARRLQAAARGLLARRAARRERVVQLCGMQREAFYGALRRRQRQREQAREEALRAEQLARARWHEAAAAAPPGMIFAAVGSSTAAMSATTGTARQAQAAQAVHGCTAGTASSSAAAAAAAAAADAEAEAARHGAARALHGTAALVDIEAEVAELVWEAKRFGRDVAAFGLRLARQAGTEVSTRVAAAVTARDDAEARAWAGLRGLTEAATAVLALVDSSGGGDDAGVVAENVAAAGAPAANAAAAPAPMRGGAFGFQGTAAKAAAVETRRLGDAAAAERCKQRLLALARQRLHF